MYFSATLLLVAATTATALLAQRAPSSDLIKRDVSQGWSLQSGSSQVDLHSCGNGAYCPISLHCNQVINNDQVAACCSSSSDCRGDVENAPQCADPAWNLWVGYDGNGFCCVAGLVGVYDITKAVAGTCVSSDNVGNSRSAVLTSTGTGVATTLPILSTSSSSPSVTATGATASKSTHTNARSTTSANTETTSSSSPTSVAASSKSTTSASTSPTSATSSSASSISTANSAGKVGTGLGLIGVAFLAVVAL